ncbi:hypothetical protein MLD38_012807 [Melastoma candidum]|uniref:Uncharacterized protein n=1 Tax=Melastoma candidum TaxID=119954 RepID=A0ACB9R7L1_9MYRT|nr:hypothetical protein MLD38_012807 [Melastoma candidum]
MSSLSTAAIFLCVVTGLCLAAHGLDIRISQRYCSHETIPEAGDAFRAIVDVIDQIVEHTPTSNGYSFTDWKQRGDELYSAEGGCNQALQQEDCQTCMNLAKGFLYQECAFTAGGRVKLVDCKMRYESCQWESATERFLESAQLNLSPPRTPTTTRHPKNFLSKSLSMKKNMDEVSPLIHQAASGSEVSRRVFGAVPGSLHPDEELRKDLGLPGPSPKKSLKKPAVFTAS